MKRRILSRLVPSNCGYHLLSILCQENNLGNWFMSIFSQAHSTKNYCLLSTKKSSGRKKTHQLKFVQIWEKVENRRNIVCSKLLQDRYMCSIAKVTNHDPAEIPDHKLNWGFWNNNNICKTCSGKKWKE